MGIESYSDILNAMSAGNASAHFLDLVAGGGHTEAGYTLDRYLGRPSTLPTRYLTGTPLDCVNQGTSNSVILPTLETVAAPARRHLVSAAYRCQGSAGGSSPPHVYTLLDIQCYWRVNIGTDTSGSTQTLTGTPSLRYTNGEGCNLYLICDADSSFTNTPAASVVVSYTNQAGTTGRSLGRTVQLAEQSAAKNFLLTSGKNVSGNTTCLPLSDGDYGVRQVASIQFVDVTYSTPRSSNYVALVLARPICTIPFVGVPVCGITDFTRHVPSLPEVKNDACLAIFSSGLGTVGVDSTYTNNLALNFIWG